MNKMERQSRRNNIRFVGVPESEDENIEQIVNSRPNLTDRTLKLNVHIEMVKDNKVEVKDQLALVIY